MKLPPTQSTTASDKYSPFWFETMAIQLGASAATNTVPVFQEGSPWVTSYRALSFDAMAHGGDAQLTAVEDALVEAYRVRVPSHNYPNVTPDEMYAWVRHLGVNARSGAGQATASHAARTVVTPVSRGKAPPTVPFAPFVPPVVTDGKGQPAIATIDMAAACADSGGTWDAATTSCVPAGSAITDGGTSQLGPMDYPRVHREALGHGYWALDLSPTGAEGVVLGVLDSMHVILYPGGCDPILEGMECVELGIGPAPDAMSSSALVWVTQHRSAGASIIILVSADGKALLTSTNDVSRASDITNASDKAAVLFEPSGGWGVSSTGKIALYVSLGVAGVAVLVGGAYYLTRKPKRVANPRRGRRRRNR